MTIPDAQPQLPAPRTPYQLGVRAFFFGLLLIAFAALFSHFVPSPLGAQAALAFGAAAAAWLAWEARPGGAVSGANPRFPATGRGAWLMTHTWARIPLMAVFGFFIGQSALDGVFAAATAAVGAPATREVTITGLGGGGRSCRHYNVREVSSLLLDHALCAPDATRADATPGRPLTLIGQGSALGLNVERLELGPMPQPGV